MSGQKMVAARPGMGARNRTPGRRVQPGMNALAVLIFLLLAFAAPGCSGEDAAGGAPAGRDNRTRVKAPIEEVELAVRESMPVQYGLRVWSGLPDSCHKFDGISTSRDGQEIRVEVWNTKPSNGDVVCAMLYRTVQNTVDLGTDFKPGVEYAVIVNGERELEFTAQ